MANYAAAAKAHADPGVIHARRLELARALGGLAAIEQGLIPDEDFHEFAAGGGR